MTLRFMSNHHMWYVNFANVTNDILRDTDITQCQKNERRTKSDKRSIMYA